MAYTLIDGYPVISQEDVEHMADQIRVERERERVEQQHQAFKYKDMMQDEPTAFIRAMFFERNYDQA